jgi:hypothetical protein
MTLMKLSSDVEVQSESFHLEQERKPSSEIEIQSKSVYMEQEHLFHGVGVTVVFPWLNEELAVGLCVEKAVEAMRFTGLDGSV